MTLRSKAQYIQDASLRYRQLQKQGWAQIHRRFRANYRFTAGDQWSESDKKILESQKRSPAQYNFVLRLLDLYIGSNLQSKTQTRTSPGSFGDEVTADRLNKWLFHWRRRSNLDRQDTLLLTDQFVGGVMVDEAFIDYSTDPLGEVKSQKIPPTECMYDLNAQAPDQSDAKDQMRVVWLPPDMLRDLAGERIARKYIQLMVDAEEEPVDMDDEHLEPFSDDNSGKITDEEETGYLRAGKVRVVRWVIREQAPAEYFHVQETGEVFEITGMGIPQIAGIEADAKANHKTLVKLERRKNVFRDILIVGEDVVRSEINPELTSFPYTFGLGYNIGGYILGKVENLKDPQRDYNKRESQITHIIGRMAKGVFFVPKGSVDDIESARQAVNSTGGVVEFNAEKGKPMVSTEGTPPAQLFMQRDNAASMIQEISGIPRVMQGFMESSHETGVLVQQKIQQGNVGLSPFLTNFHIFQNARAKKAIQLFIQHEKNHPNRMFRVLYPDTNDQPEEVRFNEINEGGQVIADLQSGDYDVEYVTAGASPTEQSAAFLQALEMAKAGIPVPPETLVKLSSFPYKGEILQYIQEQQQAAQVNAAVQTLTGQSK